MSISGILSILLINLQAWDLLYLTGRNSYFNNGHFGLEPRRQLTKNFTYQINVLQSLSHLHDSHNSSLDQQLAILLNILMGLFILLLHLRLDRRIYVDAELLVLVVEEQFDTSVRQDVGLLQFAVLFTYKKLGLEQNGQYLHERFHFDLGQVGDVFDQILRLLVEQEKNGNLKCRRLEGVSVLVAVSDKFALGHAVEPAQFTATVLAAIEVGETLLALLQVRGQCQWETLLEWPGPGTQNHYVKINQNEIKELLKQNISS